MQERDLRIDLIKVIAAAMIVILHVIENGGGIQLQYVIYLLGTFGIPLFFMVNGYLLYDKSLTPRYVALKALRYLRFILLWVVVIGSVSLILERYLTLERHFTYGKLFLGALLGDGRLYQLWFLLGLIVLQGLCSVAYQALGGERLWSAFRMEFAVAIVLAMCMSFSVDFVLLMPDASIGQLFPSPFRLITNGGYFLLGMTLRRAQNITSAKAATVAAWTGTACFGYVMLCLISARTSTIWASKLYSSPFCVAAVLALFCLCLSLQVRENGFWRFIRWVSPTTTGVWVMHPLVWAACRKAAEFAGIGLPLSVRIVAVILIFAGCTMVTKLFLRIRGVRMLFRI